MKTRFGARDSLITNESGFVHQADSGKSHFDSVPKGQNMANAKYLRKRIALVAAAALGVGMIVAAPASAAQTAPTAVGMTTATATSAALANVTSTFTTTGAISTVVGDSFTAVATISAPAGSTAKPTLNLTGNVFASATAVVSTTTNTNDTITYTSTSTYGATGSQVSGTVSFTPDIPGKYIVTVTSGSSATFTVTANAAAATFVSGTALSGSGNALTQVTGGLATFNVVSGTGDTSYVITTTGVGNLSSATSYVGPWGATAVVETAPNAAVNQNGTSPSGGVTWKPTTAGIGYINLAVSSSTTGTTTVVVTPLNGSGTPGTAVIGTVTWVGSGSTAISAANTTVYVSTGTAAPTSTTDAVVVTSVRTAQTLAANAAANILVAPKDGNSNTLASEKISATVSGPGLLGIASTQATGNAAGRGITGTAGQYYVNVFGDGTAGVATITISDGSTVLGTKTVTFYGALSTLAATQVKTVYGVGANAASITVLAKDASGNIVPSTTVYASSATTATGATTGATAVTGNDGKATFGFTGAAAGTTVLTFGNLASAPTVSTTTTVTVGSSTGTTVTLAFDKASYIPGEKAVLTLTVKDAAGNAVADGNYASLFTTDLTSSTSIGGATLVGSASPAIVGGVKTWAVYAPATVGAFSVNGTTGTAGLVVAAQGKAVTASATVSGSTGGISPADAAAVAAAKAAADAAIAAVAALSKTVASLVAAITAQIRALSALIKKLLKKRHR
jgi:hypothetical protein